MFKTPDLPPQKFLIFLQDNLSVVKLKSLLLFICIVAASPAIAQNDPVPTYLVNQDFPDSVKRLAAVDLQGTATTFGQILEKYSGRKVVLDIWASWCRDCIVGYPKLAHLMKRTEANTVYLFLSIDENAQKWKNTISNFGMKGEHYRVTSGWKNPLSSYVALDWVPRYIVIDENGRIVSPKTITSEELERVLIAGD